MLKCNLVGLPCFPRFTPGLAAGNSGGSSGTNAPSTAPGEDTNQGSTAEPGHQQFIQQMLQALVGVNPQVRMLFSTNFALVFKFSKKGKRKAATISCSE